MKYVLILIILGILAILTGKLIKHKSLYPFMQFRHDFRKRRDSFKLALAFLSKTNAKVIVETGTSREGLKGSKSNGAATIVFGTWALQNGAHLHSVDISAQSVANAQKAVDQRRLQDVVTIHLDDSINFLKHFKEKVDFLYLDSYDYSDDPEIQRKSQEHHLEEFKAIESRLHKNSVVLIDDCDLPNGGKGKLAIAHMKEKGWKITYTGYQVLLVRNSFNL